MDDNSKEKKVMSEAIQKFVFANANEVRVVMRNNEPWFVAKDVCKALEITKVDSAIRNLDADEKGTHTVSTPGGNQKMTIVSQAGLDSLILRGRKQEAKGVLAKAKSAKEKRSRKPAVDASLPWAGRF